METNKNFERIYINTDLFVFMSNIKKNSNSFSNKINNTKLEILNIKHFLNNISKTNKIDQSIEYSTKSELIANIIKNNDINDINSLNNANSEKELDNTKKIKDILDYIIEVDKEIEKNRKSK